MSATEYDFIQLRRRLRDAQRRAEKLEESLKKAERDRDRAHRIIQSLTDEQILELFRDAWQIADKTPNRTMSRVEAAMRATREYLLVKYPRLDDVAGG